MEIFPNWTFLPILFFVILLTFILNRTLFRPLGKTLEERERRITGARLEAEEIRRASQEKGTEFDRRLREARREADQQVAQVKNAALSEKNQLVTRQRSETEQMLAQGKAEIRTKVDDARRKLEAQTQQLAAQIATRILNRPLRREDSKQV
ncbi:MAG: ATP synthase F0 subunit B [Acidobacteriota bacterium]